MGDIEQLQDAQVFFALRHPALDGADDEHARVDRTHARKHVLQKTNMAWYIDDRDSAATRQVCRRETQVDGQAPFLFLGETIRVGAGQGHDQR